MDLQQALKKIEWYLKKPSEDAIDVIRRNRDEAVPFLMDYVKKALEEVYDMHDNVMYAYYVAMLLLAEFRVKEAFPYLSKILEMDKEAVDYLVGDGICEEYGAMLASVADGGDIKKIEAIAENNEIDESSRSAATSALTTLYVEGDLERDEYFSILERLLRNSTNTTFNLFLSWDCSDAYASNTFELVREKFADGTINNKFFSGESRGFEKKIADSNEETALSAMKDDKNKRYITNAMEHMYFINSGYYEEKIGVNDPCPCGSSKKYKKCCGLD